MTQGKPNLEVIAVVSTQYKDLCRIKETPNAFFQLKLDQLKLLGFRHISVCCNFNDNTYLNTSVTANLI